MKYALITNGVVDCIAYTQREGFIEVADDVYGGMVQLADGTFDLSDEVKAANQAALATQYQRDRAAAYPSIGDQLDMIYRAGLGGDEFQAAIAAVKAEYPKP
jgi:hypothetical protein